jgi:hypothetical protein
MGGFPALVLPMLDASVARADSGKPELFGLGVLDFELAWDFGFRVWDFPGRGGPYSRHSISRVRSKGLTLRNKAGCGSVSK